MSTATRTGHSRADYEALPEGAPYQLIDGDLVMAPAPSFQHQSIVWELGAQMKRFAEERELGVVVGAPVDVYLSESEAYQPDLLFISSERQSIITEEGVEGAPDLVAEVLSPSTAYHDLTKKMRVYETAGVQEYWIVDPEDRTVTVHENAENGFAPVSKAHDAGVVQSKLLEGYEVSLSELFE